MLRVGLTGGIGSGKSTAARRLADHGATVIDADRLAREVVAPGTPGLAAVVGEFGPEILAPDGSLDRERLGATVFADPAARARLNAIVHPLVGARTGELMTDAERRDSAGIVVHDVPLLVENGLAPAYHLVLVVHAPAEVRVARLVRDRGMAPAAARARIAAQASDEERAAAADVLLDNGGDPARLLAAVDTLWTRRLAPYAVNLAAHQPAPPAPPVLVEYDGSWPAAYDRLAARLRTAVGDRRLDHIGSTAVPGLPAKDVLDVQLTVSSLDEADELSGVLADLGLPVVPHVRSDMPHPFLDDDPHQWQKRFHRSADSGRPVYLHLRVRLSPGWRLALLWRDWLRANPAARATYLADKRRLAREHGGAGADAYAEAKEAVFAALLPRAWEWATSSHWSANG